MGFILLALVPSLSLIIGIYTFKPLNHHKLLLPQTFTFIALSISLFHHLTSHSKSALFLTVPPFDNLLSSHFNNLTSIPLTPTILMQFLIHSILIILHMNTFRAFLALSILPVNFFLYLGVTSLYRLGTYGIAARGMIIIIIFIFSHC